MNLTDNCIIYSNSIIRNLDKENTKLLVYTQSPDHKILEGRNSEHKMSYGQKPNNAWSRQGMVIYVLTYFMNGGASNMW